MRALTFIVAFISFGYLLVAGDAQQLQSDSVLRQKIVGTWIVNLDLCKGTETYFADGRFEARAVWNYSGVTNSIDQVTGTWGITNGDIDRLRARRCQMEGLHDHSSR